HQVADSAGDERREGDAGLQLALRQLEGCAAPAAAWEEDLLPSRIKHYLPYMLDKQCANGRIVWTRPLHGPVSGGDENRRKVGPIRTTPILLCERESLAHWQEAGTAPGDATPLSPRAQHVLESLRMHGASFFSDLVHDTGLLRAELEQTLGELVSQGLVTC